jgi:endonuclease G
VPKFILLPVEINEKAGKMWRYLMFCFIGLLPMAVSAAPAPRGCGDQFFQGETPDISSERMNKARMICFSEYALVHSGLSKTPVWSAEHLTPDRIRAAGDLPRRNPFHSEKSLPADERAELSDYKGSGFDRGHMSPNGDMSTEEAQAESFSLANMIPQDACSNEEQWEGIESTVRGIVLGQGEVYVVTGPIYPGSASLQQIGNGVLIPPLIYKAIYIPSMDAAGAYVAPNTPEKTFQSLSIDKLRELSGVDAFPGLKASVKAAGMTLPPPQPPKFHCRTGG